MMNFGRSSLAPNGHAPMALRNERVASLATDKVQQLRPSLLSRKHGNLFISSHANMIGRPAAECQLICPQDNGASLEPIALAGPHYHLLLTIGRRPNQSARWQRPIGFVIQRRTGFAGCTWPEPADPLPGRPVAASSHLSSIRLKGASLEPPACLRNENLPALLFLPRRCYVIE